MNSKKWADTIINDMKRVGNAAKSLSTGPNQGPNAYSAGGTPASPAALDGKAIAQALADYCRNNNSTTQALAIRLVNLSSKYPQRAA